MTGAAEADQLAELRAWAESNLVVGGVHQKDVRFLLEIIARLQRELANERREPA